MNNTRRTLAIVAVLTAATLVVGTFATTTIGTTQAACLFTKEQRRRK